MKYCESCGFGITVEDVTVCPVCGGAIVSEHEAPVQETSSSGSVQELNRQRVSQGPTINRREAVAQNAQASSPDGSVVGRKKNDALLHFFLVVLVIVTLMMPFSPAGVILAIVSLLLGIFELFRAYRHGYSKIIPIIGTALSIFALILMIGR